MASEDKPTKIKKTTSKAKTKPAPVTVRLVNKVCDEIALGVTLTEICARPGMPAVHAFYSAINRNSILRSSLARAREAAAELMADEITAIADAKGDDYIDRIRPNGKVVRALDDEHVRRSDLRIRTRQWLLSKMLPDRWGDRVQAQLTGSNGGPIQVEHSLSTSMLANLARLRERLPAALPATAIIEHKHKV